jgi:hypothetical protein
MRFLYRAALASLLIVGSAVASHAHTTIFVASLTGLDQSPPNASPATASATLTLDLDLVTLRVQIDFSGLTGTTTALNLRAPTDVPFAGTAGIALQTPSFAEFPLGVTSGTYDRTFDLTQADSYNPAFLATHGGFISLALSELDSAMDESRAYLQIETTTFPGGEIRGFVIDAAEAAPEPSSFALMGLGATALIARRRSRRLSQRR